jgi:hypothetical protein
MLVIEGDGFADWFAPRTDLNNTSKRTLEDLGDAEVLSLTLSRAPIRSTLRRLVDIVSLGQFEATLKRLGHDRVFHLSAIAEVEKDGARRRVVIEKNAVINISTRIVNEKDAEFLPVAVPIGLTLRQMIERTQSKMGPLFIPYNAFTNNCQDFIASLLEANGIATATAIAWVKMDTAKLAEAIPAPSQAVANAFTHAGAVADRLMGNGFSVDDVLRECVECAADATRPGKKRRA